MSKHIIHTHLAPQAIGTYSQAVKVGKTVYLSGQIPLVPDTMTLIEGDIMAQITQVFENLKAVAHAAGGDLSHFPIVNEIMGHYFHEPYPARAAIGVAALPKGAQVEMDGIMELSVQDYLV
jgi:reactive intermediate/imine deaminase